VQPSRSSAIDGDVTRRECKACERDRPEHYLSAAGACLGVRLRSPLKITTSCQLKRCSDPLATGGSAHRCWLQPARSFVGDRVALGDARAVSLLVAEAEVRP
jgi:hypothetical protein